MWKLLHKSFGRLLRMNFQQSKNKNKQNISILLIISVPC